MAPPKKDAFADLFLSAAGSGLNTSLNSNMNKLSLQEQLQSKRSSNSQSPYSQWDVLSSGNSTPPVGAGKAQNTPKLDDPFLIFETKKSTQSVVDDDLLFGLGTPSQPAPAPAQPVATHSQKATSHLDNLLDDDFTDAFTPTPQPEPVREPQPEIRQPVARKADAFEEPQAPNGRDSVLAGLVDIGFSVEAANQAIDRVGPDLQNCVNYIMSSGEQTPRSQSSRSSRPSRTQLQQGSRSSPLAQQDLGAAFQDFSTDVFKKASWFLAKSKETVVKNIEQFQHPRDRDSQNALPAWMRQQEKYKEQALERKKDGSVYEDYGTDDQNIDQEEIQRLMRLQRQREKERQKERMDKLKEGVRGSKESLRRLSPEPPMPRRPSLTATSRSQREPREPPRPVSLPSHPRESQKKPSPPPQKEQQPEEDLLGLKDDSLTPSQRFKNSLNDDSAYLSPSRRRPTKSTSKPRIATSEALNAFQESDYETYKKQGAEAFTNGTYGEALEAYNKCLESLPVKHELRIIIVSNLAITSIKLGNYKQAQRHCDDGIALVGENFNDETWTLNDKNIKYWYVKLLTRKAESLEMLENFPASLECYMELITKHGVTEKKVMDAKRRVNNIVNPPKRPVRAAAKTSSSPPKSTVQVQKIRKQHLEEKTQEDQKFKLHDQVHERVLAWSSGKEDNLRNLLMSLSDVLPQRLGFPFITDKKITINDLMLTKKVKINYMKVISAIHPDKLSKFELEDQMVCQAVFITLNKAWDKFKEQNNIA